ncbi:hypothetical protein GCM10025789_25140 [Tessaracoccus lubricantis]|uniref:Uncharacterized protein n=2 Tax=Tessaracoccus lubricantis TaxID=545543 RepID=A0ABP9FKS8_9ACTN
MIPWAPIPPETPISELIDQTFYADSTDGRALMVLVSFPVATRSLSPRAAAPRLHVTTHASFGWQRRRDSELPEYLPISGVCIGRGVAPRRVLATPHAQWPHGAAPFFEADGARLGFDDAMVVWEDLEPASAPEDDVVRLAGTLKLAFDTARAHAETVGLGHLPATARNDARRAAGAARLAVGARTEGERAAAQEQVVRILRSLALHYLPAPEAALPLTDGRTFT